MNIKRVKSLVKQIASSDQVMLKFNNNCGDMMVNTVGVEEVIGDVGNTAIMFDLGGGADVIVTEGDLDASRVESSPRLGEYINVVPHKMFVFLYKQKKLVIN